MTIETTSMKVKYQGNGTSGPWALNFPFTEPQSIYAVRVDSSGIEHALIYGTDYTVTMSQSGVGGEASILIVSGEEVIFFRDEEIKQERDFRNYGPNDLEETEGGLDKLTMIAQQLSDGLARAVKTSIASDVDPDVLVQELFNAAKQVASDKNSVDLAISNLFSRWNPLQITMSGQTDYSFPYPVNLTDKNALVYVGGIFQDPDNDYSFVNTTTIRFNPAPPAGQELRIITSTSASNPDLQSVINAALAIAIADAEAAIDQRKDEAIAEIDDVRPTSTPPVLSGVAEADEGEQIKVYIDNYITPTEDPYTNYEISVSGGTFGAIAQEAITNKWYIPWTLPDGITQDENHKISVYRRSRSQNPSSITDHVVLVKDVPLQDKTFTINDSDGWDVPLVDGSIASPATSVHLDNSNQIVSAKPEITQTSGKLTISNATASGFDLNENYTGPVITDQGEVDIVSTVDKGDGTFTATLAQSLPGVPTKAFKKTDPLIKVGAGVNGEYLGPKTTLNTYVNYGSDLIPTMTASTTAGWTITANVQDPSWPAWYVGDDVTDGLNQWYTNDAATVPKTLSVVAPAGVSVGRFRMKAYVSNLSYFPKDYVLRGRLGGGVWVDLVSVVNGALPGIDTGYWVDHDFPSGTYDTFELNITKSHRDGLGSGGPNDVSLSEIELTSTTEQSTTTSILIESSESIKDNVYVDGGIHNNLLVDGVERVVSAVSEVENGGIYITTITPSIELPAVPTSASIPNRCTLSPDSYAYIVSGDDLKITGAEIALADNPALKRLAMSVNGSGVTFKSGKVYIKEKV